MMLLILFYPWQRWAQIFKNPSTLSEVFGTNIATQTSDGNNGYLEHVIGRGNIVSHNKQS